MDRSHAAEAIEIKRHLHMFPELSLKEFKTSQFICDFLDKQGIKYEKVADTGVLAVIMKDEKLPTVAIRAEMDALPIQEENIYTYASKNKDVMHACGHDGIVAIAMELARILNENRSELKCNIKFIFEPAEEIGKGAKAMIKGGALRNPDVDKILIFHLGNSLPIGMEIQDGPSAAEICKLNIKIRGKSSHWAERNNGIDAIHAAGRVICAINDINQIYKSRAPFVVGIGTVNGGLKTNIIAEYVEMNGTLRTFDKYDRNNIWNLLRETQRKIQLDTKALIEINSTPSIPSIYNDHELVLIGESAGKYVFGKQNVYTAGPPYLAGDNAAFYFNEVKGLRITFFGTNKGENNYPLHNSRFDFDEGIIPPAIETLSRIIYELQK
jgi:amidohydrolase